MAVLGSPLPTLKAARLKACNGRFDLLDTDESPLSNKERSVNNVFLILLTLYTYYVFSKPVYLYIDCSAAANCSANS